MRSVGSCMYAMWKEGSFAEVKRPERETSHSRASSAYHSLTILPESLLTMKDQFEVNIYICDLLQEAFSCQGHVSSNDRVAGKDNWRNRQS